MKKSVVACLLLLCSVYSVAGYKTLSVTVTDEILAAFASLDTNYDGVISPEEAQADEELFSRFIEVDGDRDGVITLEEFTIYLAK